MIYDNVDAETSVMEAVMRDRKLWPGGITTEVAYTYETRARMNSTMFRAHIEIEHRRQYDKFLEKLEMNEPLRAVTYSAGSITLNNGSTIQDIKLPGQTIVNEFFSVRGTNKFSGVGKLHKVFSQRPRRAK